MYDKRKNFEPIDEKLNEIRILCNRERIPFVWIAAVYDDEEETGYHIYLDENTKKGDLRDARYVSNGLTPGTMEIELQDDKIKDVVKILNGFKAVPSKPQFEFNAEVLPTSTNLFGGTPSIEVDEEGGYFMGVTAKEEEQELLNEPKAFDSELDNVGFYALPRIAADFEDV